MLMYVFKHVTLSMKNLFKMLLNGKQLLSIILNTHKSIP